MSGRIRTYLAGAITAGLWLGSLGSVEDARAEDLAIVGGDVYTVSGAMIPEATVVVRGQRITAVGRDVAIPPDARIIDAKRKRVTPGLFDPYSRIGLVEVSLESSSVDFSPELEDPVRAAVSVADAIDPRSSLIGVARRHGVTTALVAPAGGLLSGRSSIFELVGPSSQWIGSAVQRDVAMHANFGERGASAFGGSRATALMRLAEAFDDARTFRRNRAAYRRGAQYEMAISRLDLEALENVLLGRIPLVVAASRASDIQAALAFARRERIKIVILGGEEGWLVRDALSAARVPVIVQPLANLPARFETRHARTDNVVILARAGVKVAITANSAHNVSNLRFILGNAVRSGLVPELALRAATLTPAEIYGIDRRYGSIDRGKVANLVVWTGDPFDASSYAETVVIRGEVQPTDSRQSRLAERYIRRLGLRKP